MDTTTIIRNIMGNDISINLTDDELREAYFAYRLKIDKEAVIDFLNDCDTDYDVDNIPEELIENIARKFRAYCVEMDESQKMESALMAFRTSLEEYEKKDKVFTVEVTLTMKKEYTVRAKDEDEAERIFTTWSERNSRQMTEELTDDAEYIGEWDTDGFYEDGSYDPEDADISEGDI